MRLPSCGRVCKVLNLRDDLQKAFGHLRPRRVLGSLLAGLLGLYAVSGVYLVNPGEQAVERLFGKVVRSGIGEGLHYRLPWPFQQVDKVNTSEIRRESVGISHEEHAGLHTAPEENTGSDGRRKYRGRRDDHSISYKRIPFNICSTSITVLSSSSMKRFVLPPRGSPAV